MKKPPFCWYSTRLHSRRCAKSSSGPDGKLSLRHSTTAAQTLWGQFQVQWRRRRSTRRTNKLVTSSIMEGPCSLIIPNACAHDTTAQRAVSVVKPKSSNCCDNCAEANCQGVLRVDVCNFCGTCSCNAAS